jgi:hypothetical protein
VTAGSFYSELISKQLVEERERKRSLEQRGLAVITTASVLVSLLLGVVAIRPDAAKVELSERAADFVGWALLSFVAAGILAVLTNLPLRYREPGVKSLAALFVKTTWEAEPSVGEASVAKVELEVLSQARRTNCWKTWLLVAAMTFEIGAIALLALALWDVIGR